MNNITPFNILEELIPQKQISATRLDEDIKFFSMLQHKKDSNSTEKLSNIRLKSFDIVDTLDKYSLMKDILWACEERAVLRERSLSDTELSDAKEIVSLKKSRDLIFSKMKMINQNSSMYVKRRDFMPLICKTYTEHTANAFFAEFKLWFLGDDFKELNQNRNSFRKLILTEVEFNFLRKVYFSADTPDDFVNLISQMINVDPLKVVICRFEPKNTGFIFAHKNDESLIEKFKNYRSDYPQSLTELESELHNNILVLNLMTNEILESDIINNFDIWVDIDTLVIYAKTDLFPVSLNLNIQIREHYNIDYAHFTFFDYSLKANRIEKNDLLNILLKTNPFQSPREFFVYDGNEFIDNKETFFESHCNILLIQYTITEYVRHLIVFDMVGHVILDDIDFSYSDKDTYIKLYNDALSLLELNVIGN